MFSRICPPVTVVEIYHNPKAHILCPDCQMSYVCWVIIARRITLVGRVAARISGVVPDLNPDRIDTIVLEYLQQIPLDTPIVEYPAIILDLKQMGNIRSLDEVGARG